MRKFFSNTKQFAHETNKLLLILIIAASIFGILMVHSATLWGLEENQSISRDTIVMIIAAVAGIIITLIITVNFIYQLQLITQFQQSPLLLHLFLPEILLIL